MLSFLSRNENFYPKIKIFIEKKNSIQKVTFLLKVRALLFKNEKWKLVFKFRFLVNFLKFLNL